MPEISGISLAREIKGALEDIKIIFLTAHQEHAIEAFEINADDYLLKPVSDERLLQAINRISNQNNAHNNSTDKYIINCFKNLNFSIDSTNEQLKWRTAKSREVFSYLIHNKHTHTRKDVLLELIWPEEDPKKSYAQLYSSIYQIRKTLEKTDFDIEIISIDSGYKVILHNCVLDVDLFEHFIQNNPMVTDSNINKHLDIMKLYLGDYFENEDYIWATNKAAQLKSMYINQGEKIAQYYINNKDFQNAILTYLNLQKHSPYTEAFYFELMKLYNLTNDRHSVKEQYDLLYNTIDEEFGHEPEVEIVEWYENFKANKSYLYDD